MVLPTSRENSTHSYFWKRFLSAVCILIFSLLYLQHKAFSRDEILAWVVSLFAFVFVIVLSPLQTLFFSHPMRAPVMYSINILHDPKAQRDPKERHLEWVSTLIIHSFMVQLLPHYIHQVQYWYRLLNIALLLFMGLDRLQTTLGYTKIRENVGWKTFYHRPCQMRES